MRSAVVLLTAWVSLLLAGCPDTGPGDGPPELRYGVDPCDRCQMIISEERHAAAYVTTAGEVRRFDDIGCLLERRDASVDPVATVWLHDADGAWVKQGEATIVRAPDAITPMGSGLFAFRDPERARAFATERGGEVVTLPPPPP